MALYSVYLRGTGAKSVAGAEFVRQQFSWKAFFFGPLWLQWHRLWAGLALWLLAYGLLVLASVTYVSAGACVFIALALQILLGLEASQLREAKLASQAFRLAGTVAAPALDDAELAFYQRIETPRDTLADAASGAGQ